MTRNRLHKILKADGWTPGTSRYDAEGYHLIDYVDYIGIGLPAIADARAQFSATLDKAGIAYDADRMFPILVAKAV